MSKSAFIVFVLFFIISFVGMGVWFLLSSQEGGTGIDIGTTVRDFLPFGKLDSSAPGEAVKPTDATPAIGTPETPSGRLIELSAPPVAGFLAPVATPSKVRYLERATGNIYDVDPKGIERTRLSNTTIPRVYEALFAEGGKSVLIRYLREDNATIETYAAIVPETAGGELKGVFLPQNIKDVSISPDGKRIFYLASFGGGVAGVIATPSGGSRTQIFTSLFSEWLSSWQNAAAIALTTKPSGGVPGYLYRLDVAGKTQERALGDIEGLTTLMSPNGQFVLYGTAGERGLSLSAYDTKNKGTFSFNLATLPDKCVWAQDSSKAYCGVPETLPSGKYPDLWYQGRVLLSDRIWTVNPSEETAGSFSTLREEARQQIDVVKPSLSRDGKYLFFINKRDQSLWSLDLTTPAPAR